MKAVLGLGSNSGDRLHFLRTAILLLRNTVKVSEVSALYESEALLPDDAPTSWNQPFLNLALVCETELKPAELLAALKGIEKRLGRTPRGRWAPREIDIDILLIESMVYESESLKIPHPGLYFRPFVLLPLADLVPDWKLPDPEKNAPATSLIEYVQKWRAELPSHIPFNTRRSTECLAQLVGIVNLTPDSFSDGGAYFSPEKAVHHIVDLIQAGVRVIDLGAESTRPGAESISADTEWKRLQPVLETLKHLRPRLPLPVTLSVDTRNPKVATGALRLGVDWINDVSGFQNPEMIRAVADSNADLVIMHSLTVPASRTHHLPYQNNPVADLLAWARSRIADLESKGIQRDRIIFDPGIGFGKSPEQTWQILREIQKFHSLGVRILVGHSRKSFLNTVTSTQASDRDLETGFLTAQLAGSGVDYLRVHHPDSQNRSLKVWTQANGITSYAFRHKTW